MITSLLEKIASWCRGSVISRDVRVGNVVTREPYLYRYYLYRDRAGRGVFLHHLVRSDPGPEVHDHPFSFSFALILTGGYFEDRLQGAREKFELKQRWCGPLSLNVIRKDDFHRVIVPDGCSAWTLFFHGPRTQPWGFLYPDGRYIVVPYRARNQGQEIDPRADDGDA